MLSILIMTFVILGFAAVAVVRPLWHLEHLQSRPAWASRKSSISIRRRWATMARRSRGLKRQHHVVQLERRGSHAAGPLSLWVIPVLAIAGNLAKKKIAPGLPQVRFPVTGALFTALLVSTISDRERAHIFSRHSAWVQFSSTC